MLDLRNIKIPKKKAPTNSRTISCSVKLNSYSNQRAVKAVKHNLRLTWQKSVIRNPEKYDHAWKFDRGNWLKMPVGKSWREVRVNEMNDLYYTLETRAKAIINDPDNRNNVSPNGRVRRWGDLKHNLIGEGVVHIGLDGEGEMSDKVQKIILDNVKNWLKDVNLPEDIYFPAFHDSEEGLPHLHFFYSSTNQATGRKLVLRKPELKLLQDRIAENLSELGFKRGADWDKDPSQRRRHEDPAEYRIRKKREMVAVDLQSSIEDNKKILQQQQLKIAENTETLDLQELDKQEVIDLLSEDTGNFFLEACILKASLMRDSTLNKDAFSVEDSDSFFDKITKIQKALRKSSTGVSSKKSGAAAALKLAKLEKAMSKKDKTKSKKRCGICRKVRCSCGNM